MNVTAELRNWSIIGPRFVVIVGDIYGDTRGRFKDGVKVRTSAVVSGPDRDGIVETRKGSRYKLIGEQVSA